MKSVFRSCFSSRAKLRRLASLEKLENRLCLSAASSDFSFPQTVELEWRGQTIEAIQDSWVSKTNSPVGELFIRTESLPAGWTSQPIGDGFHTMSSPGATMNEILGWAVDTPGIAYVEPNAVLTSLATPDDPDYGLLWALENTGQQGGLDGWDQGLMGIPGVDISAVEAWDITTGSADIVIAVIDSGIDYTHPDLIDNIWVNPGEIPGNGIDDDGNGFIDDVYGWDFVSNDNDPMDGDGHGTHVAGTIGAVGNNGVGISGVAWDVKLMALKGLSDDGFGSIAGLTSAIVYATTMRRDFGINVIASNNSWGGGPFSQATFDAIEEAGRAGVLFVAAAGNDMRNNNDANPVYPASYDSDNIISVAATARDNTLAPFSNIGAMSVDLAAPGVGIWSTTPNNSYDGYSGTSMASPQVAGVVALLSAANPSATSEELRDAILAGAILNPNPNINGLVATNGQLNAFDSLTFFVPPSPTATIASVTPNPRFTGDGVESINISFDLPVDGFDIADLTLEHNGTVIDLGAAQLVARNATQYTLTQLSTLTQADGAYRLSLIATTSGIVDSDKRVEMVDDATVTWTVVPPPPFEMNDSIELATQLDISSTTTTIAAFIGDGYHAASDVDIFSITLQRGNAYQIDVAARSLGIGSRLDSYLRVFDAFGRELAQNDDSRGSLDSRLIFAPSTSGTYYLGVSAYGNSAYNPSFSGSGRAAQSSGTYELTISSADVAQPPPVNPPVEPPTDPPSLTSEPNDSIRSSIAIEFESPISRIEGFIGDGQYLMSDVDLYSFVVSANTNLTIDVDAQDLVTPSQLDSYLRLFNASGQLIASNDDAAGSLDSRLTVELYDSGTYYVGVSAFGNGRYNPFESGSGHPARSMGEYVLTLSVDVTPPPPPPPQEPPEPPEPPTTTPEPNDSLETSTALTLDNYRTAAAQGFIGDGRYGLSDVDVYAVRLTAGTEVVAAVTAQRLPAPSPLDSYLRLFDNAGQLVAANDDFNGSYDSRLTYSVQESAIYYLGVSAFGNYFYDVSRAGSGRAAHTFGDYILSVSIFDNARDAAFSTITGPSAGSNDSPNGGGRTLMR